jgi:hypothetical protein
MWLGRLDLFVFPESKPVEEVLTSCPCVFLSISKEPRMQQTHG